MNDIERALVQISDIRAQMAATTRFRGYAPGILAALAAAALLLTGAQLAWPELLAASDVVQVIVWGAMLVVAEGAMLVDTVARARWRHAGMAPSMLASAIGGQLPILGVGAIVAIGICRFAPEAAWIVPGIWQLLMAQVAFSHQAILPRRIVWAGAWYMATGTLAIVLAGGDGHFSGWMIGLPLAIGHLLIGWMLWRDAKDDCHE